MDSNIIIYYYNIQIMFTIEAMADKLYCLVVETHCVSELSNPEEAIKSSSGPALSGQWLADIDVPGLAISERGYVACNKIKVNQDMYFCDYNFDGENYMETLNYLNESEEAITSACNKVDSRCIMVSQIAKSPIFFFYS